MNNDQIASELIEIEAPQALVWEILLDFPNYNVWNEFCPVAGVESLAIGEPIVMRVDIGFGLQDQTEYFSKIQPSNCIAWRMENKPEDTIHAERVQTIEVLSETRCSYISIDYFSGPDVPGMIDAVGEGVRNGFNLCAQNLKRHAEQRYKASL